ncbi:MAG: hypothetical protein PHH26_08215 [Candidatus Thermoplasmatota archaeon]|nr:hypothetical protein [Candidatus Thermoplasmatota archaeon]
MASALKVAEKKSVTQSVRNGQSVLVVNASDMLLSPGEWPSTVAVRTHNRWQKDVVLFAKHYPIMTDGTFVGMRYRGPGGATLEVLND